MLGVDHHHHQHPQQQQQLLLNRSQVLHHHHRIQATTTTRYYNNNNYYYYWLPIPLYNCFVVSLFVVFVTTTTSTGSSYSSSSSPIFGWYPTLTTTTAWISITPPSSSRRNFGLVSLDRHPKLYRSTVIGGSSSSSSRWSSKNTGFNRHVIIRRRDSMTQLSLQFQAGPMDHDEDPNEDTVAASPNTAAAAANTTTNRGRMYATISSFSPSLEVPVPEPSTLSSSSPPPTELNNHDTWWQNRLSTTIWNLQQIYGPESIAIVHDDELDDLIDPHDATTTTTTTGIPINSLIFVQPSDDSMVVVILGSDRRVNTTALSYVLQRPQPPEPPPPPPNDYYGIQLAPRDSVKSWCGFAPGTVPPILSYIGRRTDPTTTTTTNHGIHETMPDPKVGVVVAPQSPPIRTIVDDALVAAALGEDTYFYLLGGGGQPNYSCRVTIDVLLAQPDTMVGAISSAPNLTHPPHRPPGVTTTTTATTTTSSLTDVPTDSRRSIPYFAVAGPSDTYEAQRLLAKLDETSSSSSRFTKQEPITTLTDGWDAVWEQQAILEDETVSFCGRIGNVRRMARELSFCDLLPPDLCGNENDVAGIEMVFPWRNPVTDTKMAVQLICGRTLCQNSGGPDAIRQLHTGQLVLVHGRTNLQSKNSLRNWIYNQTLDIVVVSYVLLQPAPIVETPAVASTRDRRRTTATTRKVPTNDPNPVLAEHCLRWRDLFVNGDDDDTNTPNDPDVTSADPVDSRVNGNVHINGDTHSMINVSPHVMIVDDLASVKRFTKDLSQLLQSYIGTRPSAIVDQVSSSSSRTSIGLVGIDCEWRPTFFMESSRDPQPVLLLQISLHPLKCVYLFDLQTLLRPMMPQSQPMDKLETEVSFALQALFESKRLIKVGFHVVNDLRQLAASYPHVPALQFYNAVIEASTLGKKAIRRTQSGNAREATSSLSRLVKHFIGKPLNKQEQCSDWSQRPLTAEQIEYAALDAAVTPFMVEKMIGDLEASFFGDKPYLGRWESDVSFKTAISSLRFVFIHTIDPNIQRKLKAKQVVGAPMIVSQSWITGDVPPKLPMLPESDSDGGAYTDVHGIVQIPSVSVTIHTKHIGDVIDSMIGNKVGTSKDMCVSNFLHRPTSFPDGARLEYAQRSGFVEFKDGVVLFVNMQSSAGNLFKSKSYPNEWLLDGKVLTWFLRENDWQRGETPLAKKLLADPKSVFVTLFVRMGRAGEFVCCGRCRVQDTDEINGYRSLPDTPDSWTLIKLNLMLLDWKKLQSSSNFQSLLRPIVASNSDSDHSVFE